jgi:hypothetical protein
MRWTAQGCRPQQAADLTINKARHPHSRTWNALWRGLQPDPSYPSCMSICTCRQNRSLPMEWLPPLRSCSLCTPSACLRMAAWLLDCTVYYVLWCSPGQLIFRGSLHAHGDGLTCRQQRKRIGTRVTTGITSPMYFFVQCTDAYLYSSLHHAMPSSPAEGRKAIMS